MHAVRIDRRKPVAAEPHAVSALLSEAIFG
jgi:hypothetical protein